MEQITNFIKPELMVVAVVLYFIGTALKKSEMVKDKYIPFILGGIGIVVSAVYVFSVCDCNSGQNRGIALFTAITQGILAAGLSTYVHQMIKQSGKNK